MNRSLRAKRNQTKKVNYVESEDEDDEDFEPSAQKIRRKKVTNDSDDDFEPDNDTINRKKIISISTKRRSISRPTLLPSSKKSVERVSVGNHTEIGNLPDVKVNMRNLNTSISNKTSMAYGGRPCLSEDESSDSDSSDDSIPISSLIKNKRVSLVEPEETSATKSETRKDTVKEIDNENLNDSCVKVQNTTVISDSKTKNLKNQVEEGNINYNTSELLKKERRLNLEHKKCSEWDFPPLDKRKLSTSTVENVTSTRKKRKVFVLELNDCNKVRENNEMEVPKLKKSARKSQGDKVIIKGEEALNRKKSYPNTRQLPQSRKAETIEKKPTTTKEKVKKLENKHGARTDIEEEFDSPFSHVIQEEQSSSMQHSEEMDMSSDDSDEENWQDVDEVKVRSPNKKNKKNTSKTKDKETRKEVGKEPGNDMVVKDLEIVVGVTSIHKKKKNLACLDFDLNSAIRTRDYYFRRMSRQEKIFIWTRQMIGRFLKSRKILLHKCHLLCLLAKYLQENTICNNRLYQGVCLSLIPKEMVESGGGTVRWGLPQLTRFISWFQGEIPTVNELLLYIDQDVGEMKGFQRVNILVLMLRALGFLTRIISSLQPISPKLKDEESPKGKPGNKSNSTKGQPSQNAIVKTKEMKKEEVVSSPYFSTKSKDDIKSTPKRTMEVKKPQNKGKIGGKTSSSVEKRYAQRKRTPVNYNENKVKSGDGDSEYADEASTSKQYDDDSDFEPVTPKTSKRKPSENSLKKDTPTSKRKKFAGKNKCVLSGSYQDIWCEVYLQSLQTWICVELLTSSVDKPEKCEELATRPLQYVIGIDNDNKVKDVTCRYASKWLSVNQKLRVDREWWAASVAPYKPNKSIIDTTEDAKLKQALLAQDFPKSITEFKNHPLYALERHLLKYETIYPADAAPLGYIRSEAIYSRDCIHELHTRETWMKQARTVKTGELPYKFVKGRPKRNTPEHERDNVKIEVFGLWQTEVYVPPPVKDGKVPKNEYGNVELFQPSMLPEGAVHLPMNNMQKIARKLDIDHAPAMMGWDFHGGWSHPVFEGIVVAKEFEDVLLDAWREEDERARQKEQEKREKEIYENWKTLIKGILIRHKIKTKYKLEDDEELEASTKTSVKSKAKNKSSKQPSQKLKWPQPQTMTSGGKDE